MVATARRLPPMTPRVALLATAAAIGGSVLYAGREALGPFIVGLLIVYLLAPPIERLARLGLPRPLAILIVYAAAVFLVVEGLNLMLRPLVDQIRQFASDLPGLVDQLREQLERLGAVYRGLELPPAIRDAVDEWLAKLAAGDIGFDPAVILPVLRATTGFVGTIFAFLIVPVWAFYLLKDRPSLVRSFQASIPPEWRADIDAVIAIVARVFGSWVRGQVLLGLSVGIATFAGLLALGTFVDPIFSRFAVLLAVIAGVLELLPIIGPIIAAVPAILIAATAGVEAAGAAFLLYLAIQQVENNVLVPKIQGDATDLHPSAVMLALVVGGAVAGLLGAILALPITAAARDVYRHLFARLSVPVDAGAADPSVAAADPPPAPAVPPDSQVSPAPETTAASSDGGPSAGSDPGPEVPPQAR
ncbi:MAG: AI-2E family transporter [Chloroflexota bacterium]|nr:MAG: AI-2E family transporter [Chloroflexota bacterium]